MHYRIHKTYDKLNESVRFALFMALAMPGITAGAFFREAPVLGLTGLAWLLALLCSRAYFLHVQCRYNPWTRKRT